MLLIKKKKTKVLEAAKKKKSKFCRSLQIIYNTITTISINFTRTSTTAALAKATAKTTVVMMIIIIIIIMTITTMMTKTIQVTPVSCTPYIHTLQCGVNH